MNVTCKRLLSWLVVLTMVLSMVPVLDLSNFAVTTKAAIDEANQAKIDTAATIKQEIEALRETFANATGTVSAVCPACSRNPKHKVVTAVEWLPLTGTGLATLQFPADKGVLSPTTTTI